VVRGIHVGFLLLMTFGLIGNFTAKSDFGRAMSWLIGGAGFLCGRYQWIFYADLIARDGDPTRTDLAVGTLLAVLIFEGTRRMMGLALPLMWRRLSALLVLRPISAVAAQPSRL